MRTISNDVRYWMIQRIIETRSEEILQRIMHILVEDSTSHDPFNTMTPKQLELLGIQVDLAEEEIMAGKVHSQEAIAAWIDSLD